MSDYDHIEKVLAEIIVEVTGEPRIGRFERTVAKEALARLRECGMGLAEHHGQREFTAAYTSQSGVVCPFGFPTVVQATAQAVADEFSREDPDGPNYFVATRILPPWLPVTNTTKREER